MGPGKKGKNSTRAGSTGVLELLGAVAEMVSSASRDTLDDAINRALELMGKFASVDRSYIIAFSSDKQTFTATHEWCAPGIHSQLEYFVNLPMTVFPWTAQQLLAGQFVATHCLDDYPPEAELEREICLDEGIQSIIFMPIASRGNVIGTTGFDSIRTPRKWTPALVHLLQVSGAIFAACIEQQRAESELRRIGQLEQRKLGQDLHDTLGQEMTGISFSASALEKALRTDDSPLADRAGDIGVLARTAMGSIRGLTKGLLPFDVAGAPVTEILTQMAAETAARTCVACTFTDEGVPPIEDPETCTQLLWIAREAVNNAVRHGEADHVSIVLGCRGEKLSLTIVDDGIGLPDDFIEKDGIGLKVMRYRAAAMGGQVTLNPGAKSGARVRCIFPNA